MTAYSISSLKTAKCRGHLRILDLFKSGKTSTRNLSLCTCPWPNQRWIFKVETGLKTAAARPLSNRRPRLVEVVQPEVTGPIDHVEMPQCLLPDQQPTFRVSKLVCKVFATIFFVPSGADQQGEIAWKEFLQAMVATGFVPEKLYGSVWQFKLDVERSIHFHEPHPSHPSGKIPYLVARRHGRRLNQAYGWTGDMVVLVD